MKRLNYATRTKSMRPRRYANDTFLLDYAEHVDILDMETAFPEWVYRFREGIVSKVSSPVRKLTKRLHEAHVRFKLKYPVEVGGQYKFADIYIPGRNIAVTFTTRKDHLEPSLFMDEKADFFGQACEVWHFGYDVFERHPEELEAFYERLGI